MPGNWTHKAHLQSPSHQSGVSVFQYPLCSIFFLLVLKPASCFTKSNSGLLGKKKGGFRSWRLPDSDELSEKYSPLALPLSLSLSHALSSLLITHLTSLAYENPSTFTTTHTHKGISHFRVLKKYKRIPILIMKTEAGGVPKTVVEVFLELMTNVHTHANSLISSCVTPPHTHQSPV